MALLPSLTSIIVDASGQMLQVYVQYRRNPLPTTKMIGVLHWVRGDGASIPDDRRCASDVSDE
jgi:hypothetical protein